MKRRSFVSALVVLLLCAAVVTEALATTGFAATAGPVASAAGGDTWTIAVYVNADNDLYYTWPRFTLPALKRIPASAAVNVVAMLDKPKKDGAWLYRISGPAVTTERHFTKERNFGSGGTFRWFLRQVHARFPSDHLIVVGCDHGYGWRYFSKDARSDDRITMPELRTALADAGVPIDILAFDACIMGDVDVAWDIASVADPSDPGAPLVDYLVASEETIDQDGYPYGDMFAPLAGDQGRSVEQVTGDMLRGWDRYYRSLRCFNWLSLSAVDLAAVRAAGPDLADFVGRLRAGLRARPVKYGTAVREALATSIHAWDTWQVDLAMFTDRLIAGGRLTDDPGLLAAAGRVRDAVRGSMVTAVSSGSYSPWFEGLTVWAGTGSDWTGDRRAYRTQSLFGAPTGRGGVGWYALLRDFNAGGRADPRLPDPPLPRAKYGLTDVYFSDAAHGWTTGYDNVSNNAIILRTRDGGATWTTKSPSSWYAYMFSAIAPAPGGRLWAVGGEGWEGSVATRSTDGRSWPLMSAGTSEYLLGVDQPAEGTAWVCGTGGTLLRWRSGMTRLKSIKTAPAGDLFGLDFIDADSGWVLANDGPSVTGSVQRTDDVGATWTAQVATPGSLLYAIDSVGQDIWVAGGDPAAGGLVAGTRVSGNGLLLHSGDGGATWEAQWGGGAADLRLNDVDMADALNGWAVGDAGPAHKAVLLHTADGGASWQDQNAHIDGAAGESIRFDLAAVHALDVQTAWVVGDGEQIVRTTDGGGTWTSARGDVIGPWTKVGSGTVKAGGRGAISYRVGDAVSAEARVTIRIRDQRDRTVRTWRLGWQRCGNVSHRVFFNCTLPRGRYSVKVYAVDRAGNPQSRAQTGTLKVR